MKIYHEFKCPNCKIDLRLNTNPSWETGRVRCPSCEKRIEVKLDGKTRKEKE
jgi:DNA-directed RNA polymerase subunit RPC12/RpoP